MPVDDAKPDLYGAGYITGTIIGIPKDAKNQDAAWELVKYLTTDDHALAELSNGIRNVPSTGSSAKSTELKPDPNFATFLEDLRQPEVDDHADHRGRVGRTSRPVQSFLAEVAGRQGDRPEGGLAEGRQADRREAEAGGGRRRLP